MIFVKNMKKNKIRRINLISGPGAGKSVLSSYINCELVFRGYNVELIEEVIKDWTYVPRSPKGSDGLLLQAMQVQKEDLRLRSGVDLIVSDSPIFLQYFYSLWHKDPFSEAMLKISQEMDKIYRPYYVFLIREDSFYIKTGRYEDLEEAKEIDHAIYDLMRINNLDFCSFSCLCREDLLKHLLKVLENDA
jgi:hypothetical protein